ISAADIRKWGKLHVQTTQVHPGLSHQPSITACRCVAGLKKGRSTAPESQPIRPVDDATTDATLLHMLPPIRAPVQVQRATRARPGEVVIMWPGDIDRSNGKVWVYRPASHKTEHQDCQRTICSVPVRGR